MKRALRPIGYLALFSGGLAALPLAGCSGDDSGGNLGNLDSGVTADSTSGDAKADHEAGTADTGAPDTSAIDTGAPDTGAPDTGTTDTGTTDDGSSDAGNAIDAADAATDAGGDAPPDAVGSGGDSGSDAGHDASGDGGLDASSDGGHDATTDASADSAPEASTPTFCQTQSGLAFCADFDEPNPLTGGGDGGNAWTNIAAPGFLSISTVEAVSPPNSLLAKLSALDGGPDQSTKVVKMVTPANGVTQSIYEFDMFMVHTPNAGGFATDLQFYDEVAGPDRFGFRISVWGNPQGFDHASIEHNWADMNVNAVQALPTPPSGADAAALGQGISGGAWQHVKMVTAFSAATGDAGNQVSFQLYLNGSITPAWDQRFPAPFAKAPFVRFAAGVVYAFDANNKDFAIYYDNFTLKVQ